MPLYQVNHSYPLTLSQKTTLAEAITKLHSRKFKTPSIFVNVKFHAEDASADEYFMAGQVRPNSTNRIDAMVRTSEKRTKKDFDELALKVESAWYDVVIGEVETEGSNKGKRKNVNEQSDKTRDAVKLLFVVFHPMIAALENGVTIPGAGEEGNWLKDNMEEFKQRGDKGDQDFVDLVKEVEEREDLNELIK